MIQMVRIVVINIEKVLCSEVYDELIISIDKTEEIKDFVSKYSDLTKYRILTV